MTPEIPAFGSRIASCVGATFGFASGHALKHLVVATGMLVFLIGLFRRRASPLTLP